MALEIVRSLNNQVLWQTQARWVTDRKFYTSSGVSAGMDMTLAFIQDTQGENMAQLCAEEAEYLWNSNPDLDPFCKSESWIIALADETESLISDTGVFPALLYGEITIDLVWMAFMCTDLLRIHVVFIL